VPVISDFGVSRVVATTMGTFGVTANKVGGTYNLESPEQLEGEDDAGNPLRVTMQSDVWSFACTLVHALTGVPPWWDASKNTLHTAHYVMRKVTIKRAVPPELGLALALPDVSIELNVLLSACFEFDADYRPPFFSDLTGRRIDPLDFGQLGIAVILARLRDRGVPAGGYHGDGDNGAAAAANAADTATTEVGDEEDVGEVAAIRDDIKDAIAAAMAAVADYENDEGG
jgi:serine/threonine protein kinase